MRPKPRQRPDLGSGFALSTVAVSAYNWLALHGCGPQPLNAIVEGLQKRWCALVTRDEIKDALEAMALRRWLVVGGSGGEPTFDVRDPHRWIVVARERGDESKPDAGWKEWRLMPPPRRSRLLTEVAQ